MQHSERIVMFGQSCVGKTTFAKQLTTHKYICFDALFNWHLIEGLGFSVQSALQHVASQCQGEFVLDGWHLGDKYGDWLPAGTTIYVVYAPYEQIISQYRVEVRDHNEFRAMFRRWYHEINFPSLPCRYFRNMGEGKFKETCEQEFLIFQERNQ